MTSLHYYQDRQTRETLIQTIGLGYSLGTFEIDRGHENGPELHTVTSTGIIIIRNKRTKKMVTKLIARPSQIKRYFQGSITREVKNAIEKAYEHQKLGYNEA